MTTPNNNIKPLVIGVLLGIGLSLPIAFYFFGGDSTNMAMTTNNEPAEKKPLYWVAPMDANYRRDKPGKSPMGMDLVPVYADDDKGDDSGPGTIKISPEVVNNLGVRTSKVSMQALHPKIDTVGYVTYDEDKLIHIHPRVQGWVEKLYVKAVGEVVEQGQPLYDLYSPELVNAQEELLLALDRKNDRLIKAAENRLTALQLPKSTITELKTSRKVKQSITFYAPQKGVVENLTIREGFFVKPGSTLFSIGDLSNVWIEAEVFERQAAMVAVGAPVTMTLDYLPGKTWQGQVDYIYPTLDAKTRTVKVRLKFANPDGAFKPNMFAQVTMHSLSDRSALVIPREALIRTGAQDRVVLALGGGRFKSIAVSVGQFDQHNVEIIAGLSEGELIVSSAQFLLDSESSKSSDFKRMIAPSEDELPSTVWVEANVDSVMANHQMLTITHAPIPEWDWPEMTMDFTVDRGIDISEIAKGNTLHIAITKNSDSEYLITTIHVADSSTTEATEVLSATVSGNVNSVMLGHRMVNISRGAIEKWGREPATMDFIVAENVDMDGFVAGADIQFTFEIRDGEFVVVDYQVSAAEPSAMDHSKH